MKTKFNLEKVKKITFVMEDENGNKKSFKEEDLSTVIFFGAGFNDYKKEPDGLIRLFGQDKFFYGGFGMLLESIIKKIGLLNSMFIITDVLKFFGVPVFNKGALKDDFPSSLDDDVFKDNLLLKKDKNKLPN